MTKLVLTLSLLALGGVTGCATTSLSESAVLKAKDRVAPAMVHIRPVKEVFAGGQRVEMVFVGSGFIIGPEGYVVTNEHVASEADQVRCVLSTNEELEAEVVGIDPDIDLAVLKLKAKEGRKFPVAKLGSSKDLTAGQTVLALGSPHGLARSVSRGIISVPDRYLAAGDELSSNYHNWIQTDAAINRGNSGGPLVNLRGEVIGINTRKLASADNVGFAIPIDIAQASIDEIIRTGRVSRSWIGVNLQEMLRKTDDPEQSGVVIADVDPLSPAKEAGIQPGDVMLSAAGHDTNARFPESLPAVRRMLAGLAVGQPAPVVVSRGGQQQTLTVVPVEKRQQRGKEAELQAWGFTASDVTSEIARQAQLTSTEGAFVSGVQAGSLAANAGLQHGDIIIAMDEEPVRDLAAFEARYRDSLASKLPLILLEVKRGALTRYVLLEQTPQTDAEDIGE
jgi:serine protease Do